MRQLLIITVVTGAMVAVALTLAVPTAGRQVQTVPVMSCENLASMMLPDTTITVAQTAEAGAFIPPVPPGGRSPSSAQLLQFSELPAFCRVAATLKPSSDSDIKMEVWMPVAGWNGKLQAVGNGAFTGFIRYGAARSMASGLELGYATSATDTGHVGGGAEFGFGHPEKVIDFGWRSVHEMTVTTKAVIAAYYGNGPRFSYWFGCSAGGRQAMKEAQRFPEDFDGIIAGAPGHDWTSRAGGSLRVAKPLEANEASRLSSDEARLVHTAVLEACDADDGVTDGVVGDPEQCEFDPAVLQCAGVPDGSCLTTEQVNTVRMLYASPANPKTGRPITGLLPGSELGWTDLGWTRGARATGLDQFRYLVYGDPDWTVAQFNFETDIVRAEESDNDTLNALDPNLKPFFDRGGKLLSYHGWSDPQISPANITQYYRRVVEEVGSAEAVHDSFRLFMAPGMGHCGGGAGPNTFDALSVLEEWVEEGRAPDLIVASRSRDGVVDRTRPLCPYPQLAVYQGVGSTDDAENFACRVP